MLSPRAHRLTRRAFARRSKEARRFQLGRRVRVVRGLLQSASGTIKTKNVRRNGSAGLELGYTAKIARNRDYFLKELPSTFGNKGDENDRRPRHLTKLAEPLVDEIMFSIGVKNRQLTWPRPALTTWLIPVLTSGDRSVDGSLPSEANRNDRNVGGRRRARTANPLPYRSDRVHCLTRRASAQGDRKRCAARRPVTTARRNRGRSPLPDDPHETAFAAYHNNRMGP